ncbi:hypothetical protein K431DRAFT_288893 [Polychaeton citri CBS 116435]|uniref:CREG-like beta-barrel domain-containing protein n=1 Tax=Polychaeton citri CBS 116435 TaxID=1314669 RepID=A0A9P4PXZ9_9PEZI|nr:hypothetical protein K431DRAFT_288893 [Polychaeton citri CBS 116435]
MKSASVLLSLGLLADATSAVSILRWRPKRNLFESNQQQLDDEGSNEYRIPTVYESTVQARRILHLTKTGTLTTVFPEDTASRDDDAETFENRPAGIGGTPIGLMEYVTDCPDPEGNYGNPTMLAINIATPYKNYYRGSNISLSLQWWPDQTYSYFANDIPTPHTPAALPRFSLIGRLESVDLQSIEGRKAQACFLKSHPDSVLWQPGNDIHESHYVRLVVDHVYWFGGFGDRARIGWLPIEDWRSITLEEIENIRLPGEKKKADGWWRDYL